MPTYQRDSFDTIYKLAEKHIQNNLDENMRYAHKLIPGIDPESYRNMEDIGFLQTYTARDNNNIIGYAAYFVVPNTHYLNGKQALNDVIYVAPEYRKKDVAFELLKFAEADLKEMGVDIMYVSFKKPNELVNKLDYALEEYKYMKYIGE